MVTKRVSPVGKKATKLKSAAPVDLTDSGVFEMLASASVDPDTRRRLVAAEAYFIAERRGFAAGNELEDWVTAEAVVDSRLQQMKVA
jgi:Protein of unknown function (DUF2934)